MFLYIEANYTVEIAHFLKVSAYTGLTVGLGLGLTDC